ncbi:MAG: ABC transporter ATP-binding protein, partial [Brachybacterium sp.]|nr:ABC transporter ATP-binding protein [Brachybacterium sp.]
MLLAGASGSGKSTVLRTLAGLLDPSAGDIAGRAEAPVRPGARGLLLQQPLHALIGETIGRDTAFGPENVGLDREAIQQRVTAALRAAAVDLDADRACLEASGGQQQRVALAGALALGPDALLLDEPTSMLDADAAAAVRSAVIEAASGRRLVVAEHRIGPWLEHVDRLVVLGPRARILADGPP